MTAVDFSAAAIERGRAASDEVSWVVADIRTWEPDDVYHLVVIAYLQLSVEEFEPLIRRVVTWLTPGGELFMVGHDRSNIEHGVGGPQVPAVLWDVEEIVPWLNGLDILEAEIVERDVVGDDSPRVALDTLIRARLV
jgi:SAM-dependent methyltransferase